MNLSRHTISNISSNAVQVPDAALFQLPEKVLQFGTGVLLRGLPGYFIDKANRQGIFNGRIVVVKSTPGDASAFEKQDGLYTICARGLADGKPVEENSINSAISRVLHATEEWQEVLACAHNREIEIIISNTTEAGIQLVKEDIGPKPPASFPGKLLAFLYERFKVFGGSSQSGMVIVPTELIPDNGKKLQSIVLELAQYNGLEDAFLEWLKCCNTFCNSLVDRVVPGKPDEATLAHLEQRLGYADELLIIAEDYRLWAIEGDEEVKNSLSFYKADKGVIIEPDIEIYRELKLRLLNATHTFTCGLAYLSGCRTVKQGMKDEKLSSFLTGLMLEEILPSIPGSIERSKAEEFAKNVIVRFQNPYLDHKWLSITLQYSSKMRTRCIPLLLKYYERYNAVPERMSLGFAAYLCFSRPVKKKDGQFYGEWKGEEYPVQDTEAESFYRRWNGLRTPELVQEVLGDRALWETDLRSLPGFEQAVLEKLNRLLSNNVKEGMDSERSDE